MSKVIKVDFDIDNGMPTNIRVNARILKVRGLLTPRSIQWKRWDENSAPKKDYKITMLWKGQTIEEPEDLIPANKPANEIAIAAGGSTSRSAAPSVYGRWSYLVRVQHPDHPNLTDTLDPTIIFKRGVDLFPFLLWVLALGLLTLLILWRQT